MKIYSEIYSKEKGLYFQNNRSWHQEDSEWKAKQVLKIIDQNRLSPKSVADVGCGGGEVLNQLHKRMVDNVFFKGFDISPDAFKLSAPKSSKRLEFLCEDFLESDKTFDLIMLIDVFEHLEDYFMFLKKIRTKGDMFIFHIPLDISVQTVLRGKLNYHRERFGHLHYFTKATAFETLKDCGFTVKDWFYTAGSLELPPASLKAKFATVPRKLLFRFSKDLASRILGGFSLMVLAFKD